jgi:hypothetical protein
MLFQQCHGIHTNILLFGSICLLLLLLFLLFIIRFFASSVNFLPTGLCLVVQSAKLILKIYRIKNFLQKIKFQGPVQFGQIWAANASLIFAPHKFAIESGRTLAGTWENALFALQQWAFAIGTKHQMLLLGFIHHCRRRSI